MVSNTEALGPRSSCSFNPVLSERRTDALRRPTCRGGSKSKAEPRELCKQRREREISPSSLRSSIPNWSSLLILSSLLEVSDHLEDSHLIRGAALLNKIVESTAFGYQFQSQLCHLIVTFSELQIPHL